jgi:DNA-directed RNA polymerase subunit M
MQFCPKCGSILVKKTVRYGCPRCSYTTSDKVDLKVSEKVNGHEEITVIKDKDVDVLPTVDEECPKCGHDKAHFWTSQTRSGDEAETKFFRCKKCRATWREYR